MKTKTTMLEYCKLVLQSVSFNKQLFKKEYRKAIKWLKQPERLQLKHWIRSEVRPTSLVLRKIKSVVIFFLAIVAEQVSSQSMFSGVYPSKSNQTFYMAYADYVHKHVTMRASGPVSKSLSRETVSHKKELLSIRHFPGHRQFKWGSVGRIHSGRTRHDDSLSPLVNIQVKKR